MLKVSDWLNEKGKQYENIIQEALFRMRCCIPAIVQSYNAAYNTIECQPTIREKVYLPDGNSRYVNLPLLINVPLIFPGTSQYTLKFPINKGDEVLVFFSDLSLDNFWEKGNVQNPIEQRRHDLSDGLAIPASISIPSNQAIKVTQIEFTNSDIIFKAGGLTTTLSQLIEGSGGGGTFDHTQLNNRDVENQHPIEAITNLRTVLDNLVDTPLTYQDILDVVNQ